MRCDVGARSLLSYNFPCLPSKRTGFTTGANVLANVAKSIESQTGRISGLGAGAAFRRAAESNCRFHVH